MRVLITGSNGFIGKNLAVRLREIEGYKVIEFNRENSIADLRACVAQADAIVHLAGVNRPKDLAEFTQGNADLTARLCEFVEDARRNIPLVISSSIQADLDNPYGKSKRDAELAAERLAERTGNAVTIYRLPNVFGKWCRPNYNSVVATFCHNVVYDLPIQVIDAAVELSLVYVDDVVTEFVSILSAMKPGFHQGRVAPIFRISLGELADQIMAFRDSRSSLISGRVGAGFVRALYATYVSYLPPQKFAYDLPRYADERGVFVEMLKTQDSGQFSFFTAHPGITRGGHYHHTKTEKFLVIKGAARFRFRHVVTDESYEVYTSGDAPRVVETIPGWTHDVTNIGDDELIVMLWANEIFDRERPDTIACKV